MEIYFFKVECLLIISHLRDNYGVLLPTIGLSTKSTAFRWWRKRFKRQFELVDILRLDHFRALAGYWRVDGNAQNAINGTWINSPGKELLNNF